MRYTLAAVITPALIAVAGLAGPIAPTAGPVGPTMKTLAEVEPRTIINAANTPGDADSVFKITQPGSYILTGNLTGVSSKSGIEIAASNVTIDFNGFTLTGVAGSLDGVRTVVEANCVSLRNGTVSGFGGDGVDLTQGGVGSGGVIEGVHARGNGGRGIMTQSNAVVSGCTASENGTTGIYAQYASTVTGCTASGNGDAGIQTSGGSTVSHSTASANGGDGIFVTGGCSVTWCSSRQNSGRGVFAESANIVANCSAQHNTLDGIYIHEFNTVSGNNCDSNGNSGVGAGIHATGSDNRIEGNACYNADTGVDVDGAGNVIVRNTCAGNTVNWSFVINNVYGPIIDRASPISPAVNGNSAGSTLTSADPNANFTH